eukprot:403335104
MENINQHSQNKLHSDQMQANLPEQKTFRQFTIAQLKIHADDFKQSMRRSIQRTAFMISANWFNEWAQLSQFYSDMQQYGNSSGYSDQDEKTKSCIKQIDNASLITEPNQSNLYNWEGKQLRKNLQEGVDYFLINQKAWYSLHNHMFQLFYRNEFQDIYGGGPEICIFIVPQGEQSLNMLQLQLSQETGVDYCYIGGYPDLNLVKVTLDIEDIGRVCVPVSQYLPISIFKPWILNKFGFGSNNYCFEDFQGNKISPQSCLSDILGKDNNLIRVVKTQKEVTFNQSQIETSQSYRDQVQEMKDLRNRAMHLGLTSIDTLNVERSIEQDRGQKYDQSVPAYDDDYDLQLAMQLSMNPDLDFGSQSMPQVGYAQGYQGLRHRNNFNIQPKITIEDFDNKQDSNNKNSQIKQPVVPMKTRNEKFAELRAEKLDKFIAIRQKAKDISKNIGLSFDDKSDKIRLDNLLNFEDIHKNLINIQKNQSFNFSNQNQVKVLKDQKQKRQNIMNDLNVIQR